MRVVRFKPEHLARLDLQDKQASLSGYMKDPEYAAAIATSQAFTALDGDKVLCCSGVIEIWQGRAVAWALISKDAGRHFLSIHRAVHGFLKQVNYRRVEATVEAGFPEAWRWIEMLGFTQEGLMKAYGPDGSDHYLFARVR